MSFVRAALRRVAHATRTAVTATAANPARRLRLAAGAAAAASTAGALWLSAVRAAPARAEKAPAAAAAAAAAEKPKADAEPKAAKAKGGKKGKTKKAKAAAAAAAAEQKRVDELVAAAVAEGYDPSAYAQGADDSTSAAVDPLGSPVVVTTLAGADAPARYAIAQLREDGNSGVTGVVLFEQPHPRAPVKVRAVVKGLKAGKHGLHVHEFGDLRQGCVTAGPHFNPLGAPHGGPGDNRTARHSGDLGNITATAADANGEAVFVRYEHPNFIGLYGGIQTIVGRSVVVHADEDDLGKGGHADSKTTGHAGARLACGVIGLMAPPAPAAAAGAAAAPAAVAPAKKA